MYNKRSSYNYRQFILASECYLHNIQFYLSADLETMTERLHLGYYTCSRLFIADMRRIFNNCKTYNERNTEYYCCAIMLEKFFVTKMKDHHLWIDLN